MGPETEESSTEDGFEVITSEDARIAVQEAFVALLEENLRTRDIYSFPSPAAALGALLASRIETSKSHRMLLLMWVWRVLRKPLMIAMLRYYLYLNPFF